jgi:DNA-binding response OmpR family regulator
MGLKAKKGAKAPPSIVLVADDDEATRRILFRQLCSWGFHAATADDGRHLLQVIERIKPDLVLLDLIMPRKDGLEVLKELVVDHPAIPVIVISGDLRQGMRSQCLLHGAADYLPKPLNFDHLHASIKANLPRPRRS